MPAIYTVPNVFQGRMYTVTITTHVRHRRPVEMIGAEAPSVMRTDLTIRYQPVDGLAELLSLDSYLESFVPVELTAEEAVLRIVHDFQEMVKPEWVEIIGSCIFLTGRMELSVKAYGKQPNEVHKGDPK